MIIIYFDELLLKPLINWVIEIPTPLIVSPFNVVKTWDLDAASIAQLTNNGNFSEYSYMKNWFKMKI